MLERTGGDLRNMSTVVQVKPLQMQKHCHKYSTFCGQRPGVCFGCQAHPSSQPHYAMAENKREKKRHEDRKENTQRGGKTHDRLRGGRIKGDACPRSWRAAPGLCVMEAEGDGKWNGTRDPGGGRCLRVPGTRLGYPAWLPSAGYSFPTHLVLPAGINSNFQNQH